VSFMKHQRSWELWLSKRDHLPRKLRQVVRVSFDIIAEETWSNVTINADISNDRFVWSPPPGWKEWRMPNIEEGLLRPGTPAPDFELAAVDGGRLKLSNFRGQIVWLNRWRCGWPACREETGSLQKLYSQYKDKGLVVLGVNTADDRKIALEYLKANRVTFPNVLDSSDAANRAMLQYETLEGMSGAVPMTYIIDREGKVVAAWYGYEAGAAEKALEKLGLKRPD
jgi:peroxiredoxin